MSILPDTAVTEQVEPPWRDDLDTHGARVESAGADEIRVEIGGMEPDDYGRSQTAVLGAGWGPLALGRIDPTKPHLHPHKRIWDSGRTGWNGTDATPDTLTTAEAIATRILGQERGILNSGARMPVGVIGLDVDAYGDKHGLDTLTRCEARWGSLPPTYRLTARDYASGSGIRFHRVPDDWIGVGEIPGHVGQPSHVEIIQRHHRYAVAPGGLHHTGQVYRLHDERTGAVMPPFWLPPPELLPELPAAWLDGLRATGRTARRRGSPVTPADVAAFADEHTFNEFPGELDRVVGQVLATGRGGNTRNACRDALWIAAHKAAAGCYPWQTASTAIRSAACTAYAERGRELDARDFDRMADGAVAAVLDRDDYAELTDEWGEDRVPDTAPLSVAGLARIAQPTYRPAHRPAYRPSWRTL